MEIAVLVGALVMTRFTLMVVARCLLDEVHIASFNMALQPTTTTYGRFMPRNRYQSLPVRESAKDPATPAVRVKRIASSMFMSSGRTERRGISTA